MPSWLAAMPQKVEAAVALGHRQAVTFHEQTRKAGHRSCRACRRARRSQRGHDDLLVLFADTPLTRPQTLLSLRAHCLADGADVAVLGFRTPDPTGYGRLIVEGGELVAIREDRDASDAERAITFCNGGIMAINGRKALELLVAIGNANAKGEYYLTDIVEIARAPRPARSWRRKRRRKRCSASTRASSSPAVEAHLAGAPPHRADARGRDDDGARRRCMSATTRRSAPIPCLSRMSVFGTGVSIGAGVTIHAFTHLDGHA